MNERNCPSQYCIHHYLNECTLLTKAIQCATCVGDQVRVWSVDNVNTFIMQFSRTMKSTVVNTKNKTNNSRPEKALRSLALTPSITLLRLFFAPFCLFFLSTYSYRYAIVAGTFFFCLTFANPSSSCYLITQQWRTFSTSFCFACGVGRRRWELHHNTCALARMLPALYQDYHNNSSFWRPTALGEFGAYLREDWWLLGCVCVTHGKRWSRPSHGMFQCRPHSSGNSD